MRARFELAVVPIESGFGRPLTGGIVHHQGRVETDQAVRLRAAVQRRQHLRVVADRTDAQQDTVVVEHRNTGRIAARPGQVHAGEEHGFR